MVFLVATPDIGRAFVLPDGIPSTASRAADICHMRTYNAVPVSEPGPELGPGEEFDHSSVIFPNLYEPNFREMEYAVPFADYEETFAEVRHLFLTKYPDETYPVESRPVKADDSYLSAYAERDGYAIGVSGKPEASTWPCFAMSMRYSNDAAGDPIGASTIS